MSLYDYKQSIEIAAKDYSFYALVMAAMRQADSDNILLLESTFPEVYTELKARYHAPGGVLPDEQPEGRATDHAIGAPERASRRGNER